MKEHLPLLAEKGEIEKVCERLNENFSEIYNDLGSTPVNLPYRDCLREIVSAASALTDSMGSSRTREATARAQLGNAIERIAPRVER
jgi:hypothetical protein